MIRREAQTVGGVYLQDAWRVTPQLTLNYGLRWELSGPVHNTNDIYTSPTVEHLLGPSRALFQPGTFSDVRDPQIFQRSRPYKGDYNNAAPNAGFAWNPQRDRGFLGRLFGKGKSVIRGGVGVNYYDEGLINFQQVAGANPGLNAGALAHARHARIRAGRTHAQLEHPAARRVARDRHVPAVAVGVHVRARAASARSIRTSRRRSSSTGASACSARSGATRRSRSATSATAGITCGAPTTSTR